MDASEYTGPILSFSPENTHDGLYPADEAGDHKGIVILHNAHQSDKRERVGRENCYSFYSILVRFSCPTKCLSDRQIFVSQCFRFFLCVIPMY